MKKYTVRFYLACTCLLFSFQALAQNATSNVYTEALPEWQSVLDNYVDDKGRTDFISLADNMSDLNTVVDAIAQVSPDSHPDLFPTREAVLSYHINAYNALAMHGVIDRGIPKNFSSLFKRASFFRFREVVIGGKKTNLYHYENNVIRPIDDPRTHFALNCMVRDCPRLYRQAYTPENYEQTITQASIEFLNSPQHVKVNDKKETVYVSGIMKFYTEDFTPNGKAKELTAYINPFRENKIPDSYKVKYLKYDWTVNQQPK